MCTSLQAFLLCLKVIPVAIAAFKFHTGKCPLVETPAPFAVSARAHQCVLAVVHFPAVAGFPRGKVAGILSQYY